jgi:cellulose biosynthesis protein BcsQ
LFIACWATKGGSGTTVVAASLALLLARAEEPGTLLVDTAGDVPAALGVPEPSGPGLAEWLDAPVDAGAAALARLEVTVRDRLALLPRGTGPLRPERAEALTEVLGAENRHVVVDCGTSPADAALALALAATTSLLVTRPCYLAMRRALAAPLRPSGIVVVREPGRSLTPDDVSRVLGVPIRADVEIDPAVARAVDAGLLATRLPRSLERALRSAA